ncbi:MAG TPA: PKD domain-containing protein [Thermoplasmata archaeon]
MVLLKRDTMELILGLGVLALGIGILLFSFSQAFALATHPGSFLQDQMPDTQAQAQGPSASFAWNSNSLNLTVQDTSQQGDAGIASWNWDFGDGTRSSGSNPGNHVYSAPGPYQVSLIVRDSNGKESRAFAQAEIVTTQTRSGESALDPSSQISGINFDFSDILLPVGIVLLTFGMYLAMVLAGGMITRAGWNLVKPKPETIRVRLKPKHLTQAFEEDAAAAAPALAQAPLPVPPPPQS